MKTIIRKLEMMLAIWAAAATVLLFSPTIAENAEKVIFTKDSLYHRILVHENDTVRTLLFGAGPTAVKQSRIDIRELDRHLLEYTRFIFAGLLLNKNPGKVLIIGLGGGVIPREMRTYFPDAEIDVIEIDPDVINVAERFFFFHTDDKLRVQVFDGRVFVRRQALRKPRPSYDFIILDAFNKEYIPFHLTTLEFFKEVAAVLHPQGVVVANVFGNNKLFDAEFKTFRKAYGRCYPFFGKESTNTILVAPGPDVYDLDLGLAVSAAQLLQKRHEFNFDLIAVAKRFRSRFRPGLFAKVLTDDHAPVNILLHNSR